MNKRKITPAEFRTDPALRTHIGRSREVARALDQKAAQLPHAHVFTSFEFEEFIGVLTPKRLELLRLATQEGRSIADLALACQRDQSAVSKDIARLEALGLVAVKTVRNAGHGRKKLVLAVADTISIHADFALAS